MKFDRPVIDSHMHHICWTDFKGRNIIDFFRQNKIEHGLKGYNLCALATCYGEGYDVSNIILAAIVNQQYKEIDDIGFDGVKMLETKPTAIKEFGFDLADSNFDPFFELCEKNGTHMIWHAGDPETFWDINRIPKRHFDKGYYYGDGSFISLDELYKTIYSILKRHPLLRVTFAHFFFCSYHPETLVGLFDKYKYVGVDVTPGAEMYGAFNERRDFYRDFFIKYADRIMYGTDTVFGSSNLIFERILASFSLTSSMASAAGIIVFLLSFS